MAVIIPLPAGIRPEHRGLSFWMERVLIELEHVRESPEPETVHDLRVALRRCRSMSAAMEEVDAHPAWPAMREAGQKLFRRLGALRDVQVQEEWVKKLAPEGDALRNVLLSRLEESEKSSKNGAFRIAGRFDRKKWKGLARTLRLRVRHVPAGSLAAECLALERFGEAHELHRRALRTERAKPWHRLRIGVKRFRYTVEGFLPTHYASWSEDLKRVQDLLGEVHDLDVLLGMVKENAEATLAVERRAWEERIEHERHARIETYRQLTLGTTSLWNTWRLGLPSNGQLEAAAMARIEATARAADPHLRRTMQAAQIARAIGEALRRAKIGPVFTKAGTARVFLAAARLHGVRPEGIGGTAQKAARKFLASLPVPAGWTEQEWQVVTLTVRYHRGAEPKPNRGRLAKMGEEQQKEVFMLAGMLRLGRALRKIGVSSMRGIRAENGPEAIVLTVPEIPDSPEVSARLAAAKHLLERGLGKAVLLRTAAVSEKVLSLPVRTEAEAVLSTENAS